MQALETLARAKSQEPTPAAWRNKGIPHNKKRWLILAVRKFGIGAFEVRGFQLYQCCTCASQGAVEVLLGAVAGSRASNVGS